MSDVQKHEIPTAVTVKPVLALIAAHRSGDEYGFKTEARKIANELRMNDKDELAMYILAQIGDIRTFEVTD